MSELAELQKNLNYKIKAQDIGLASWKGAHGKPQKMYIPTKDYLLNTASGQQDDIRRRNEMMADYMERQNTPIIIDDEYGDPIEYKYHNIPPPDLFYDPVEITIPKGDKLDQGYKNQSLNADEMIAYLQNTPAMLSEDAEKMKLQKERLGEELKLAEKRYKEFSDNLQNGIDAEELQHELHVKYIKENYRVKDWSNAIRLDRGDTQARIRELKNMKRGYAEDVQDIKQEIDTFLHNERLFFNTMEENKTKILKVLKSNEDKVKTYAQALNNLNKGELNTSKNFNETDEEYVERLHNMASVPFADRNSEMKALMREKERLRDNLKLIIRDDSTISQVVNGIYQNEPLLMYEINKFYPGFQEYFIKKYGVNNDKINFKDIINEVSFYLKRSTDPRVLAGNVPSDSIVAKNKSDYEEFVFDEIPTLQPLSSLRAGEESESESEEGEVSEGEVITKLNIQLIPHLGVNETMAITNSKGKKLYIKMYNDNVTVKSKDGGKTVRKEFTAPIFFTSETNKPGSFRNIPYQQFVNTIASFFNVSKSDVYYLMGKKNKKSLTKNDISIFLSTKGLLPTLSAPPAVVDNDPIVIGYGIKNADNIPEKVPFGPNILFLKKLFLKNILSIQNKHRTKINGFNNVHVSDNFVKIIMNLLKGVNFTNSELQNLTNNEKLLLDNLLILSELNKKFVTGSATASLNQLKKDYEVLIGEINAGNNNELLKKKLYNLLMRMVHFGALSQIQALKHYKEILKSHF
jgi:hypothetical protein